MGRSSRGISQVVYSSTRSALFGWTNLPSSSMTPSLSASPSSRCRGRSGSGPARPPRAAPSSPHSVRASLPPKRVSCLLVDYLRSQRQVMSIMLRQVWLTPYIGSSAMRSCAFFMASTSIAAKMLSIYSLDGLYSPMVLSASACRSRRSWTSASGELFRSRPRSSR